MANTAVSIFLLLLGAALISSRGSLARLVVEGQKNAWGFTFGRREERLSQFVILIVGLAFVMVGLLALVGIIDWKTGIPA
jgi:hypothetical protein